jgi:hypothetical protein
MSMMQLLQRTKRETFLFRLFQFFPAWTCLTLRQEKLCIRMFVRSQHLDLAYVLFFLPRRASQV